MGEASRLESEIIKISKREKREEKEGVGREKTKRAHHPDNADVGACVQYARDGADAD